LYPVIGKAGQFLQFLLNLGFFPTCPLSTALNFVVTSIFRQLAEGN
jgi:hypothetical protein